MAMAGSTGNQEYCLKWNNHRSTILSVMDSLLEEESLVDVTLSAESQFIRAHRVVLSACSPYFRSLFKSEFLNDKHPVIVLKDVEFENLKSLVEYMYKGEANVPQHMLSTFIQTAESLQVRGLAEGASKQKLEQVAELNQNSHLNIPSIPALPFKQEPGKKGSSPLDSISGGILAARLAKMVDAPPMQMFDFHEQLALAARQHAAHVPPPMKKPRKVATSSPIKQQLNQDAAKPELSVKKDLLAKSSRMSPKSTNIMAPTSLTAPNNNYESDSDVLKIDEDRDTGKENKENAEGKDDDIAEMETGGGENGVDSEEEAMTKQELAERAVPSVGFINPWTGEEIPGIPGTHAATSNDDDDINDGGIGPVFPSMDNSLSSLTRLDISDDRSLDSSRDPLTNKYACTRCGRSYLHQATLVRHQRYECGISASYPCQLCGRKFKRRDVLKGHMEKCLNKSNISSSSPLMSTPSSTSSPMLTSSASLLTANSPLLTAGSPLLAAGSPLLTAGSPLLAAGSALLAASGQRTPPITSMPPFSGGITQ